MDIATREEVVRVFPGIADHVVLEILAAGATVSELDAALILLQGDDEGLIEFKRDNSSRLYRLIGILENSGVQAQDDLEV